MHTINQINIPKSVQQIGTSCFYICVGLISVTFDPNCELISIGQSAFNNCNKLESIILPEKVTLLGGYCFGACSSLATFTIPASLTSIEPSTFSLCKSLITLNLYSTFGDIGNIFTNIQTLNIYTINPIELVTFTSSLQEINIMGSGAITISADISNIETIKVYSAILNIVSFGENTEIPSIEIHSENEEILIESLNSVKDITFINPNNIKKLTCKSCESLNSFDLSQFGNLEEIGNDSFKNVHFTSVEFPSSLKIINSNCFTGCNALENWKFNILKL